MATAPSVSAADIDTWVKQRVPVVAIVGNDGR
jgi:hypothetical protein